MRTLLDAEEGRVYTVVGIAGGGRAARRLLDMGFTPNCELYVARTAPFGGTVLVSLRGFFVALRRDAAKLIEIRGTGK